jgi:tetratricopeptide (TPR) repeat protein
MSSTRRAFVIMPFGEKMGPNGVVIDFNAVYEQYLAPAIRAAKLVPFRADADQQSGAIHLDMFQGLLLAEFVVADLTVDNPNVWYEIGVRHALRSRGAVLTYALRDRLPFDIAGQRMQRYTLKDGRPVEDKEKLKAERAALTESIVATLGAWRGRRASPVYQQMPNLMEPNWKQLKVGDINQYWQELEEWQRQIDIARGKQRPGDILVLAQETPNSILEVEALCVAAKALLDLYHPRYALEVLERARKLDPDDPGAQRVEAIALGRLKRYAEAKESLRGLSERFKDGETVGLFARTLKDEWTQLWRTHDSYATDPLTAAQDTEGSLRAAAAAYVQAFRSDPADYYPGINALTLGRLWEHVTSTRSKLPLDSVAGGVGWCVATAIDRKKDYWALATRAELALLENRKDDALEDYGEAAAMAVEAKRRFQLDSSSQQLDLLAALGFRVDIVTAAAKVIDRAERQLDALIGVTTPQSEPKHVIVFSGHMIDNPEVRGPGKEKAARFPVAKVPAVASRIRAALDRFGAGAGDLGLSGGASGGDLLFAEACLERGMRLELYLARKEADFLGESVTFADPDHRWEQAFMRAKAHPRTRVLIMPDELGSGPKPDPETKQEPSVHERCNRWILYSGLSHGLGVTELMALWNGEPGDGVGGTEGMIKLMRSVTGRQPEVIDPRTV